MQQDGAPPPVSFAESSAPGNGTDGGDDAGAQESGQLPAQPARPRARQHSIYETGAPSAGTSKRRFHPQFTEIDQDGAARLIQKTYRGALDRRDIQRRLRIQERLKGGPEKPWNFEIDGVRYMFAERALCGLTPQNR